mmetsp:Transcript_15646/g.36642  ORF Transcript_15646/g.36642 Transcript_15646/m.36642 type:complete len:660 (+) Transcript_15646:109-2088(+)
MRLARKKDPKPFVDVFANVLMNRTGITLSKNSHSEEELVRNLERTQRQDGLCGDEETAKKSEGLKRSVAVLPAKVSSSAPLEDPDSWSDDAKELMAIVDKLGPWDPNITSEAFIKPFFRNLRLQNMLVNDLDDDIMKFTKLTYLDISQSPLEVIANLPPTLKFLKAYSTQITRITCRSTPALQFLGLGYSPLAEQGLSDLAKRFPNLLSLDLSFTKLSSIEDVVRQLQNMSRSEDGRGGPLQLCLQGTPLSLLPFYRLQILASGAPGLQLLDGVPVSEQEQADALALQPVLASERPPLEAIKIGVRLSALSGFRTILTQVAESFFAGKKRDYEAAVAAAAEAFAKAQEEDPNAEEPPELTPPEVELEGKDRIFEACLNGSFRLAFELPQGLTLETGEVFCKQPTQVGKDGKEVPTGVVDENIFDQFDLTVIKAASGEFLNSNVNLAEAQVGWSQLREWLQSGMPMKAFFRRAAPPPPGEEAEDDKAKAKGGKKADPKAKAKADPKLRQPSKDRRGSSKDNRQGSRQESRQESKQSVTSDAPPERPPEVQIAAGKIALDYFLRRTSSDLTDEIRQAPETLPAVPAPWKLEVSDARLVATARRLEPEVQVPQLQTKDAPQAYAKMKLSVILYVDEEQEERERALALEQEQAAQQPAKKGKK